MTATVSLPPTGLASFPPALKANPYQRLLYEQLATHGFEVVRGEFDLGWLIRSRRRVRVLHFHWPLPYYRHNPSPAGPLSWLKLALFAIRLLAARALGYRIAWTVHEVYPLVSASRALDRAAAWILVRASQVLIANDQDTATRAVEELGSPARDIAVVPHASYVDAYPAGRDRAEVRRDLGIAGDDVVVLCFGHVSAYKRVDWLVEVFQEANLPRTVLVVAGMVKDEPTAAVVRAGAADGGRVKPVLEFVPDEGVRELFEASDVAVCPRHDGGTSAVLILALSMGVGVVAANTPTYAHLTGDGAAGWLFEPDDRDSLTRALAAAAADPEAARRKGQAGIERARALGWPEVGRRTAELLRGAAR
jgi:beta-1,4-mannosyltransferase